ncbi:hypothetical protein GCM10020220_005890 [Nonomuraea rubra]
MDGLNRAPTNTRTLRLYRNWDGFVNLASLWNLSNRRALRALTGGQRSVTKAGRRKSAQPAATRALPWTGSDAIFADDSCSLRPADTTNRTALGLAIS